MVTIKKISWTSTLVVTEADLPAQSTPPPANPNPTPYSLLALHPIGTISTHLSLNIHTHLPIPSPTFKKHPCISPSKIHYFHKDGFPTIALRDEVLDQTKKLLEKKVVLLKFVGRSIPKTTILGFIFIGSGTLEVTSL